MREAVTVLMPVKNGIKFIQSARENIEKCTLPIDEILIIDDQSSDGTHLYLEAWAQTDSRVLVLVNEKNGLANALNLGLSRASKRLIARFDVDDRYEERRIDLQVKEISKGYSLVFCDYRIESHDKNSLGYITSPVNDLAIRLSLARNVRTPHPGALFVTKTAILAGGYQSDEFPAEDLGLWLRMSRLGKFSSVPDILLHYRIGMGSVLTNDTFSNRVEEYGLTLTDTEKWTLILAVGQNWKEILNTYKQYPNSSQRSILFLFDLIATTKATKVTIKEVALLLRIGIYLFMNFKNFTEFFKLIKEQRMRKKYRQSLLLKS